MSVCVGAGKLAAYLCREIEAKNVLGSLHNIVTYRDNFYILKLTFIAFSSLSRRLIIF